MRTTIDIPDDLAIRAKKAAVDNRTTLRDMVLRGLQTVLAAPHESLHSNPLDQLEGLGKDIWKDVDPDAYVKEQRKGWE